METCGRLYKEMMLDLNREHRHERGSYGNSSTFISKTSIAIWSDVYDDFIHLNASQKWWHTAINNSGLFKFVRNHNKSLFSHTMMLCEWGLKEPELVTYMIDDDGPKEDDTESPVSNW